MDTPTHGLVGRLVARSVWPQNRGFVNLVTVTSILPDVDVFFSGDALDSLQTHRGVTHSFFGAAIGAFVVAWAVRRFILKDVPFTKLYAVALTGLLLHILFDVVTSYGTMVLMPFSRYRALFDVLFVIDPYLDLILIGGLVLGWKAWRPDGYRLGLAALTAYMVFNVAVSGITCLYLDRWASERGLTPAAAVPVPFSPLHRRGIVSGEEEWYEVPVSLYSGVADSPNVYRSALAEPRLEPLWERRDGRIYRWFARFPAVVESGESGRMFLIHDLRFGIRPDALGWLGSLALQTALDHNPQFLNRRAFTLRVRLDERDRLEEVKYSGGAVDRDRRN
ncbi:MAG: metal-dependent hydrolase [Gemmatimonadetes bacterium]|nr:metal-dependent hydrolase [Gemmatimonadota bacterium]MDE3258004.1 metal-dependent hydrolase [Gemmatimonadota bacterium]